MWCVKKLISFYLELGSKVSFYHTIVHTFYYLFSQFFETKNEKEWADRKVNRTTPFFFCRLLKVSLTHHLLTVSNPTLGGGWFRNEFMVVVHYHRHLLSEKPSARLRRVKSTLLPWEGNMDFYSVSYKGCGLYIQVYCITCLTIDYEACLSHHLSTKFFV